MKKLLLIVTTLFSTVTFGQLLFNTQGQKLFEEGTKLIELGKYKSADSILTVALCTFKNENVYFNRGVSRLYQNDTLGFCEDLYIAANRYFDYNASKIYNQICCTSVDTIYYDKKLCKTNSSDYRYYEEKKSQKYYNKSIGIFHDIKAKNIGFSVDVSCESTLTGANYKTVNIIAIYELKDSVKYYSFSNKPAIPSNQIEYDDFKKRAKILFDTRYGNLKTLNNIRELVIYYDIIVNSEGDVVDAKYIGTVPEILVWNMENPFKNEIEDIARNYPKFKPAKFKSEKVNYIKREFISY